MNSVKKLVETSTLTSIPSKYIYQSDCSDIIVSVDDEIPTIDLSLLIYGTKDQQFTVVQEIENACREWGFFMVVNHGMKKELMDKMIEASREFFDLTEEEKGDYKGKQLFDPIKYGTSFNTSVDKTLFWRDHLKVHVHPHFNSPQKPSNFREISQEYCKSAREVANQLFKGISMSLGFEQEYIHKAMELDSGSQILVVNYYPKCPQPEVAMGLPPHSDHGLLTLLIQNEFSGLQVMHNGKWVPINPIPYSILVNTGDHMEILTNGIYKSVIHRAMVNKNAARISIGTANGPPLEKIVEPARELLNRNNCHSEFRGMKYKDYLELQQSNQLNSKSCLDLTRA